MLRISQARSQRIGKHEHLLGHLHPAEERATLVSP